MLALDGDSSEEGAGEAESRDQDEGHDYPAHATRAAAPHDQSSSCLPPSSAASNVSGPARRGTESSISVGDRRLESRSSRCQVVREETAGPGDRTSKVINSSPTIAAKKGARPNPAESSPVHGTARSHALTSTRRARLFSTDLRASASGATPETVFDRADGADEARAGLE